jgi:uncharacterized protein YggU (UPF0235/DUF167 family)
MAGSSIRLRLRVAPGAHRAAVVGRHGDGWKIRVAAAPEQGRANDAVMALLADVLGVARPALRLVAGARSRDKVVELSGLGAADADERLAAAGRSGAREH